MEVLSFLKQQTEPKQKIILIETDKIHPNPYQPRKFFDAAALSELSESIKQFGIIQPLCVRKVGTSYELVAGERRLKAAALAGLLEVPCILYDYTDNDSAIIALLENLQRQNLSFFEEADAYHSLIKKHGLSQEALARRLGKSQSSIANKLRLLRLPPSVKNLICDYNLSERHARSLLRLSEESLQISAAKYIHKKALSVADGEALIEELLKEAPPKPTKQKKDIRMYKDIRIFINTIKSAVDTMVEAGINATAKKSESDEFVEYIIKIPKCR